MGAAASSDATPPLSLPAGLRVFERGWLSSNNVLALDEGEACLIDSGHVSHAPMTGALVRASLGGRRLTRILNTHLHSDHCGGNAALVREHGARVLIPPGLAGAVRNWDVDALTYGPTGQDCERFDWDEQLAPGARLEFGGLTWEVMAAPGHDPHAVMFWCETEGILISGDVLWEHGFGVIFPELEGESGFAEQARMLEIIDAISPRLVIPGHGAVFAKVPAALARARARLDALAADPARNARNAARALLKFHLLAVGKIDEASLLAHLGKARYFGLINERYFALPFDEFVTRIVSELVACGAARREAGLVFNSDA